MEYEKQIQEINNSYSETIKGKDSYIEELEEIKRQKDALEEAYHNTIDYKLSKIKMKFKK